MLVRLWKRGSRLKAGEYRFDHPAPVTEVYARIARGDVFTLPITLPEGSTRFDIAAKVVKAGFLNITEQDFLAATFSETPLIADLDPHAASLEGYLFPDTYRFPRKATAIQIVTAMEHRFRAVAAQLGIEKTPLPIDTVGSASTISSPSPRSSSAKPPSTPNAPWSQASSPTASKRTCRS